MKKQKVMFLLLMLVTLVIVSNYKMTALAADTNKVETITIGKKYTGDFNAGADYCYAFTPQKAGTLTITIKCSIPTALFTAEIMDKKDANVYRTKELRFDETRKSATLKYVIYVNPVTYHLKLSNIISGTNGKFTIATSFKEHTDSTAGKNATLKKASTIKNNSYYIGYIAAGEEKDYYKIKVNSGQNLRFKLECYCDSVVNAAVYDSKGTIIAQNGNAGFNNYAYEYDEKVEPGTYYIEVSGVGSFALEAGKKYGLATGKYVIEKSIETISAKSLYVGKTFQLGVTRTPENSSEKLTYSSSNAKIVTVSASGKLKAVKKGTATITIKGADTGVTAKVKITVKEKPVTKVQITAAQKSVYVDSTLQLKAKVTPADATNASVTWKSSNQKIATVNSKGLVKGIAAGECTITATAGGKKATYKITVNEVPVSSVSLNRKSLELMEGSSATLKATVLPENAGNQTVTYRSSDNSIATVSSRGVVTAKKAGSCTITAVAGNQKATCKVTVNQKKKVITSITMQSSLRLTVGAEMQLSVTVTPSDADTSGLSWTSSDSSIVSVANGKITCKKIGYATIVVESSNGVAAMCTVSVGE